MVAVYTPVSDADLALFLADYELGRALSLKGVAEGVENSNFLLETERGRFVLTLYEGRTAAAAQDLPFFLDLMSWLATRDFPCPIPQPDRNGMALKTLNGRPAALVTFLPGLSVAAPDVGCCREAGAGLARLHRAAEGFGGRRPNALGRPAWRPLFEAERDAAEHLLTGLGEELEGALDWIDARWPSGLPRGVVHADLFPDNVFFDRGRFVGAIDFYFACQDLLAYDVAVMLCAWAFDSDHRFDPARAAALVDAYGQGRPLSAEEREALPVLGAGAAMRFLLTRLADWRTRPAGALVVAKDPMEYLMKLRAWRRLAEQGVRL